ncbi:MAG TPA: DNA recombination protein RmuC [Stellaceae bacterium]|jgi:DNA recombination protein RmuC|nr:DNA recombination protein RmuC [Stellaceae bacterium]
MMEALGAGLMLIVGLALGGGAAWWLRGRELAAERAAAEAADAAREDGHRREIAGLTALRSEIDTRMQSLAADALQKNQSSFLNLANEVFAKHRDGAAATLEARQKEIGALLAPISKSLEDYKTGLGEIEKARAEAYGGLSREMASLVQMQADASSQTRKLVNALQAAPKTRGRWGEHQLHNVMELSGMSAHVDFRVEETIAGDDGRLRPDVIIRLPGERRIVVDAKTSMAAYLDAVEASDDETREAHLQTHAKQLRTHMRLLSAKAYWDALPCTPDFVAMFIPGENFYAAAIERDPALFEDAIENRVLIVTPTTLIALAKAIAVGWRQEKIAENARHIGELGRELYRRLMTMGGHVAGVGAGLDTAVKRYNELVGSFESRVLTQARRFSELELDGTQDALPEPRQVETQIRPLRAPEPAPRDAAIIPLMPGERLQPGE